MTATIQREEIKVNSEPTWNGHSYPRHATVATIAVNGVPTNLMGYGMHTHMSYLEFHCIFPFSFFTRFPPLFNGQGRRVRREENSIIRVKQKTEITSEI